MLRSTIAVCVIAVAAPGCLLFETIEDPDLQDSAAFDAPVEGANDSQAPSDTAADAADEDAPRDGSRETTFADAATEDRPVSAPDSATTDDASDDAIAVLADAGDETLVTDGAGDVLATDGAADVLVMADVRDAVAEEAMGDSGVDANSGDVKAADAVAAATCTPNTYVCAGAGGNVLKRCSASGDALVDVVTCPSAATCSPSLMRCTACTPGASTCSGAQRATCNSFGSATTSVICATPELCAASSGASCAAPACAVGERRCQGQIAQVCNPGRTGWSDVETCTGIKTCGGGGTPGVCGGCSGTPFGLAPMANLGTFCIDVTEVSVGKYQQFLTAKAGNTSGQIAACADNTSFAPGATGTCAGVYDANLSSYPAVPVTCVDWCDAAAYCAWAGKRLCGAVGGGAAQYASLDGEWYSACSGGGPQPACGSCNCYQSAGDDGVLIGASPAGWCHSGAAPYSSVVDLRGNAVEWENSCDGQTVANCRVRGGSYRSLDSTSGCDYPEARTRLTADPLVGFRCCASL